MSAKAEKIVVPLSARSIIGKKTASLRAQGMTPAVVYGHGVESQAVAVDSRLLNKVYAQAGGNKILGLKIGEGKMKNGLIHDVQMNVRTGAVQHADFFIVSMDEKIKTEIPLHFVGESTAVYQLEGTLVRPLETIEVEALPGDLPESFEVDISVLEDFDATITVADLKIPENVEILSLSEELIARVERPISEEELEADLNAPIDEAAEMPEGVQEDLEVVTEEQQTRKEGENRAAGADPTASK